MYEVSVKYYFTGYCPSCGTLTGIKEFDTLEELNKEIQRYNNTADYLCSDCEQELNLKEK